MKKNSKGFTLVEMLIAIALSITVLSALIVFFFRSSKLINLGQDQAKIGAMVQFIMNKVVRDVETANTDAPVILNISDSTWRALPALPYSDLESSNYSSVTGTVAIPAAPAARRFISQIGLTDKDHKWYPNPCQNTSPYKNNEDSNSLVFYKVENGTIYRITYRKTLANKLVRERQSSPSTSFYSPVPEVQTLLENVNYIQFTYPVFQQEMNNNGIFESTISSMTDADSYLNKNYRKTIGIKLSVFGSSVGKTKEKGIDLETQVRVRN